MSSSLLLNNIIITGGGPISLPTKGTWSNNTMLFVLNSFPTQLTATSIVSKTALDFNPPNSFTQNTARVSVIDALLSTSLYRNNNFSL